MASERLTAYDIFGDEPPDTIVLPGGEGRMLLLGHIGHDEILRRLAACGWPGQVDPDGIDHVWVVFDRHGEDCAAQAPDKTGCVCRNQAGRRAALAWYVHRAAAAAGASAVTFAAWHPSVRADAESAARRSATPHAAPRKEAAGVE